jgi:hypothetical protein
METSGGIMWIRSNQDNSISKAGLIEYYLDLLYNEQISVNGSTHQRLRDLLEKETPKEKVKRLLKGKDILY